MQNIKFSISIFIIVTLYFCGEVTNKTKDLEGAVTKPVFQFSKNWIGEKEYNQILNDLNEECAHIAKYYPKYLHISNNSSYSILNGFCINKEKNKLLTCLISNGIGSSSIEYFCGFKYNDKWEFFRQSASTYYFNKNLNYPDSIAIPMEEMNKYALRFLSGYLIRIDTSNEWEINNKLFSSVFEGLGWWNPRDQIKSTDYYGLPDSIMFEKYRNKVKWRNMAIEMLQNARDSFSNINEPVGQLKVGSQHDMIFIKRRIKKGKKWERLESRPMYPIADE